MMNRLAVSNIAWPAADDAAALDLVAGLGFAGVDIAPAKIFGSLDAATPQAALAYKDTVEAKGLKITAMQGLLFGLSAIHLFADEAQREALARRLIQVAMLAGHLGGVPCVFGAPRLRDPGNLNPDRALDIATSFFHSVAPAFADNNSVLAFEANPGSYGCRFVTHTGEAVALAARVAAPGFGFQFDTGTVVVNAEPISDMADVVTRASHLHISEPDLAPVGTTGMDHRPIAEIVRSSGYSGWMSVEMKETAAWRDALALAYGRARLYGV